MPDWHDYYEQVGHRPNQMVRNWVEEFVRHRTRALDLGSGNFRDSRWLKHKANFERVDAVDPFPGAEAYLHDGIRYYPMRIQDFLIEEAAYDLIIAMNSLYFLSYPEIARALNSASNGLREHGVLAFNLLGDRDDWIAKGTLEGAVPFSERTARELLEGSSLETLRLSEHEIEIPPMRPGSKSRWHVFDIALLKRSE